jgi:branched-subunit amino acid transport protein
MSGGAIWVVIAVITAGCYGLKYLGLSVPSRVLDRPAVRRVAELVPVALLAALIAVQTFGEGRRLTVDPRAAGLAAAAVAVLLRAPFLVVVVTATGVAALLRAVAG